MARYSIRRGDHIECGLHLIFTADGDVRMTRGEPSLGRHERSMGLTVRVPLAIFRTPALRATIHVADPGGHLPAVDVSAVSEALRGALGVDVDLVVIPPPEAS